MNSTEKPDGRLRSDAWRQRRHREMAPPAQNTEPVAAPPTSQRTAQKRSASGSFSDKKTEQKSKKVIEQSDSDLEPEIKSTITELEQRDFKETSISEILQETDAYTQAIDTFANALNEGDERTYRVFRTVWSRLFRTKVENPPPLDPLLFDANAYFLECEREASKDFEEVFKGVQ